MKTGLWILILALTSWTIDGDHWIGTAWAGVSLSATNTSTSTVVNGSGQVVTQTTVQYLTTTTTDASTDTSVSVGAPPDPTQQNAELNNQANNNQGANQSSTLGMAAIAGGTAMAAAGAAMMANPPTAAAGAAMMAAGMAMIASGMAALAAADQMNNNANQSGTNAGNLNNLAGPYLSTLSSTSSTSTAVNTAAVSTGTSDTGSGGSTTGIQIDPALTRTGQLDTIFSNMENQTGLTRDALMNAVSSGQNPVDVLANSPAMAGNPAGSAANLQKIMDDTMAKGNLPSGQEVMDKLGLTPADLGGSVSGGGADPNRTLASANNASLDGLFPARAQPPRTEKMPVPR